MQKHKHEKNIKMLWCKIVFQIKQIENNGFLLLFIPIIRPSSKKFSWRLSYAHSSRNFIKNFLKQYINYKWTISLQVDYGWKWMMVDEIHPWWHWWLVMILRMSFVTFFPILPTKSSEVVKLCVLPIWGFIIFQFIF